jgi:hypothetical protein
MKFREPRRSNPFDRFWIAFVLHAATMLLVGWGLFSWLAQGSFMPALLSLARVTVVEGVWWWFSVIRR